MAKRRSRRVEYEVTPEDRALSERVAELLRWPERHTREEAKEIIGLLKEMARARRAKGRHRAWIVAKPRTP
jgi:DNA-binding HxlR family transcriptional regulator